MIRILLLLFQERMGDVSQASCGQRYCIHKQVAGKTGGLLSKKTSIQLGYSVFVVILSLTLTAVGGSVHAIFKNM